MSRVLTIVAVLGSCVVATLPASAAGRPKALWATINFCDTAAHPDQMGVRASMPGDGLHTRMWMRFTEQYYERSKQDWKNVEVTPWVSAGSGQMARAERGRTFTVSPPANGETFVLRGVVDFKWTRHRQVIRTYHLNTKAGHPATADADPPNYSASLCEIS